MVSMSKLCTIISSMVHIWVVGILLVWFMIHDSKYIGVCTTLKYRAKIETSLPQIHSLQMWVKFSALYWILKELSFFSIVHTNRLINRPNYRPISRSNYRLVDRPGYRLVNRPDSRLSDSTSFTMKYSLTLLRFSLVYHNKKKIPKLLWN